jgi:predicted lipoprotein with Yx(FWY)xxD motif
VNRRCRPGNAKTAWSRSCNRPAAGEGANDSLLATIRRSDGSLQATYAGRPLYYYIGDKRPGQILCQGVTLFGGLWLVERADGRQVR